MSGFSFGRFLAILVKEFVQMRRDRLTFAMIIGIPIMQLILFGFAINSDPKNLPAVVRSAEIPWVGGAARAELRWMPVEVLALGLAFEGLFAIVRPRLDVGDGLGGVLDARSLPPAGLGVVLSAAMVIE